MFGQRFVWVTDCYAAKFLLFYKDGNRAILWVQMCLMCWDVDIIHRPDSQLLDANYWFCLGINVALILFSVIIFNTGLSSGSHMQP